jgi:GGDEF domain-containing protein
VTRQDLAAKLAGRYAFALYQWKPVERVAKTHLLVVNQDAQVNLLASSAMDRAHGDLYDPIIVVDDDGNLAGSVTVRSLLRRSVELQLECAQGANPLTGLPGNAAIHRWILGSIDSDDLAIAYADLDRFKEYNDRYGFLMGDEVIRLASRVLTRVVDEMSAAHLGHVGGDDFVAVFPGGVDVASLEGACREFDEEKRALFDAEDLERGHILAKSRTGELGAVPIVTLSVAVILRKLAPGPLDPARVSHLAAALKTQAKRKTLQEKRSAVWVERRVHANTPSGSPIGTPSRNE